MKKKPFWRRVNRGFVVSMALLAVVLVYVLVTQLMLIPERAEIRKLTDDYRELMVSTTLLTDEQVASLKNETALEAERKRLKSEVSALFVKDSGYIDNAVEYLTGNIRQQTENIQRVTSLGKGKENERSCVIDQDVATSTVRYTYTMSGEYTDYATEEKKQVSDVDKRIYLTINCKKVNGEWKIYRVSSAGWDSLNDYGYYGKSY